MESSQRVTDPAEPLDRFLFDGHYRKSDMTVKWQALKPQRHDNKTSVYLTNRMSVAAIWALGAQVAVERNQPLRGRTRCPNRAVIIVGLFVELDPPPDNHACICGWPPVEDEPSVMEIAQELAASCSKVETPPPDHWRSPE